MNKRLAKKLVLSLFIGLFSATLPISQAQISNFKVPQVFSSRLGPQVVDPYSKTTPKVNLIQNPLLPSNLQSKYTSSGTTSSSTSAVSSPITGVPSKITVYDPFETKNPPSRNPLYGEESTTLPIASFRVRTSYDAQKQPNAGTVNTYFEFNAAGSHDSTGGSLRYRWDFDGDGKMDTFFSARPTELFAYTKTGEYTVRLEVQNQFGQVASSTQLVKVVENTSPESKLHVSTSRTVQGASVTFDATNSFDSQYANRFLLFRFDFDGDGAWDTKFSYSPKTTAAFQKPGLYLAKVQVVDPEGKYSEADADKQINIEENHAPNAVLTANSVNGKIILDLSGSTDDFTPKSQLRYRWDLNYTGTNDIIFNNSYLNATKLTINRSDLKSNNIRVQVVDAQGLSKELIYRII